MDFVTDTNSTDRGFYVLVIVDDYSRKCSIISRCNCRGSGEQRLYITTTTDNGLEFVGRAQGEWAYQNSVKLNFIRPENRKNAFTQSLIGRLKLEVKRAEILSRILEDVHISSSPPRKRRSLCWNGFGGILTWTIKEV